MVARDLRFIVLGEDDTHVNFVRRWLLAEGVQNRQIIPLPVAADTTGGAGEQYVRERYVAEVRHYRSQANHQRIALIAVIDADTETVSFRQRQLDEALDAPRRPEERIAILVPRRHVETWLTALLSPERQDIDESKRFRSDFPRGAAQACVAAGPRFGQFLVRDSNPLDLLSMTLTRPEVRRMA